MSALLDLRLPVRESGFEGGAQGGEVIDDRRAHLVELLVDRGLVDLDLDRGRADALLDAVEAGHQVDEAGVEQGLVEPGLGGLDGGT